MYEDGYYREEDDGGWINDDGPEEEADAYFGAPANDAFHHT